MILFLYLTKYHKINMDCENDKEFEAKLLGGEHDLLELAKALHVNAARLKSKGVDVSKQLSILVNIDSLLSDTVTGKDSPKVRSGIAKARSDLVAVIGDLCFKEKTLGQSQKIRGGFGVLIFLSVTTIILFACVIPIDVIMSKFIQDADTSGHTVQGIMNARLDFKIIFVPAYVYVWGVIGTLAYLLWACITHIAHKNFDNYYIPWYFLRVPLGAIMAAAIYYVVVSGFITLNEGVAPDGYGPFIVLAFVSGFSIRYSMNTIDKVISAMMPNKQDVKTSDSDPPKEVT